MKPTEILSNEHRVIEKVLLCLERMAEEAEKTGQIHAERVKKAVDFFQNFADRCHHAKEEDKFFPLLEEAGFSPVNGPTAVMRYEHEEGRKHVREMLEASKKASEDPEAALGHFLIHARSYINLLREHIQKEDHCLFPMAEEALTESAKKELLESFEHVEEKHIGHHVHEKYEALAEELSAIYKV